MSDVEFARRAPAAALAMLRAHAPALIGSARRRLRAGVPRLIAATAASAICLSAAVIFWPTGEAMSLPAAETAPPVEEWRAVPRPIALFGLEAPELQGAARSYDARRHVSGAREDLIRFGSFEDDEKPFLALRFHRNAAEPPAPTTLFLDAARQAGREGRMVERIAAPTDMTSKFGSLETADASIASADASRACVAFRTGIGDGALDLSGLACGTERRPMDRAALACLIDRIALLSAGDDHAVRDAFAAAELKRQPVCSMSRLTAAGRRATWLDPSGQAPPLKGGVEAKGR